MTTPTCQNPTCGKPIERRPTQSKSQYLARKFCSINCSNSDGLRGNRSTPELSSLRSKNAQISADQRIENVLHLLEQGESPEEIASRMGVKPGSIARQLYRRKLNDIAARFERAQPVKNPTCQYCHEPIVRGENERHSDWVGRKYCTKQHARAGQMNLPQIPRTSVNPIVTTPHTPDPACYGIPQFDEIFFPSGSNPNYERARKICATCPLKAPCLQYALETDQKWGMWGGLSPEERTALRRRMARRAAKQVAA